MKYYLAHHGVQNQHWGVRHGPPYPLDSNASKQAKRKSASKSSYDKLYGDKKGSTSHTGSLLRNSNKTKEVSILKRKDILENRLRNKSITRDEMIELTDINRVVRDLNTPGLELSQRRADTMNKQEIAKEQKRKRIKTGIAVGAGAIGLISAAALARKNFIESEKASIDLKKIKSSDDAIKEGIKAVKNAPVPVETVSEIVKTTKNNTSSIITNINEVNDIWRSMGHSDLDGLYLAHHGVQNQHWGVRHGPPYPLDSNASKQAKRKSASKSSYDKLYGDKKGSSRHTGSIMAPAIAVGTSAAYVAGQAIKYKIDQRKNIRSISNQITDITLLEPRLKDISSELKPMDLKSSYNSLKKIPDDYESKIKDINNINKISKKNPTKFNETTENCCNCATAYILRQAGYDVKAKPFTRESVKYNTDTSFGLIALSNSKPYKISNDEKMDNTKKIHNIFNKANTNIAYATLQGHCFIMERNNGKLITIDPQDPKSNLNGWDEEHIKDMTAWSGSDLTVIPVNMDKIKSGQGVKYYDKFVSARY